MVSFDNAELDIISMYGGSDQKRGIIYRGDSYMLKLPDRPADQKRLDLNSSYSNSAIAEYVSCHIIELIGIPVQSTEIETLHRWSAYHNSVINDLVVACKRFVDDQHILAEFKLLANTILPVKCGKLPKISEVYDVLQPNAYFTKQMARSALNRYWDTFIIDALLGNFDRHGNNWGYLINKDSKAVTLAPIYDCGSCLYPQVSDAGCEIILQNEAEIELRIKTFPNAALILNNGKKVNYFEFINSGSNTDCDTALLRIAPLIDLERICGMIDSMQFLTEVRRNFYKLMICRRYEEILLPRYRVLAQGVNIDTGRSCIFEG